MQQFDYLIIGGGSAGIASAIQAMRCGAKSVAVVEAKHLGGTCINHGCIPHKVLFHASWLGLSLKDAKAYGFQHSDGKLDWPSLLQRIKAHIVSLQQQFESLLAEHKVTLLSGSAKFTGAHTIEVNGQQYHAKQLLLANGCKATLPSVPGAKLGITIDQVFELEQQPKNLVIVGAGKHAVSTAALLLGLGSQVTLIIEGSEILPEFDSELAQALQDHLTSIGLKVVRHTQVREIEQNQAKLQIFFDRYPSIEADCLIWNTPRLPDLEFLGDLPIKLTDHGYIAVDQLANTSIKHIYAIGDIAGQRPLTSLAVRRGRDLATRLFSSTQPEAIDLVIPEVLFVHPPLAQCGLTETEAHAKYGKDQVKIYRSKCTALYSVFTEIQAPYLIKWVCVGQQERVVGCHVLGLGADEIMQGFAAAIQMQATRADLLNTLAVHPSCAEQWLTTLQEDNS
jgi:glutathione reductase (NADPH)